MDTGVPIFDLAERRLDWLDRRQRVLSQNIANADTPDYHPRDLAEFGKLVSGMTVAPAQTSPLHLAGSVSGDDRALQVRPNASAPDGNGVDLEDQMIRVADDETSQALVGNLWKIYMGMFMTAVGKG